MAACGIQAPNEAEPSSLKDVVLYAGLMEMRAQRRYRTLTKNLKNVTGEVKAKLIDEYIDSEPVGFYRELAIKSFREQA